MSLNMQTIVQRAQEFSPKRFYQPENSPDYALVQAVVEETNLIVGAAATQTNFIFTGTISSDVARSWQTLFTVTGANQVAQAYDALAWSENQTIGGGGAFSIDFRYTSNGISTSSGSNVNLGPGLSAHINPVWIFADVGTLVEWSYEVTAGTYVAPTSVVRAGFSFVQRN